MHSLSSESLQVIQVQAQERERDRDESKGLRASRVSNHLRMSSRGRSISPASTRYSQPEASPVVPMQLDASLSPHGTGISPSSPQNQTRNRRPSLTLGPLSPTSLGSGSGEVVSPRPMPSPKLESFPSLGKGKTADLARLEALAELVPRDMSADAVLPGAKEEEEMSVAELLAAHESALAAREDEGHDKTLPVPPVPSSKPIYAGATPVVAQRLFAANFNAAPEPRTPTLSALSLLKPPRGATQAQAGLSPPVGADGLSGLDALERRLLAEVGTRKTAAQPRTDVRALGLDSSPLALGIDTSPTGVAIPPGKEDEAVNDSAISSLSLGAEGVWDHLRAREEEKKVLDEKDVVGLGGGLGRGVVVEKEDSSTRSSTTALTSSAFADLSPSSASLSSTFAFPFSLAVAETFLHLALTSGANSTFAKPGLAAGLSLPSTSGATAGGLFASIRPNHSATRPFAAFRNRCASLSFEL